MANGCTIINTVFVHFNNIINTSNTNDKMCHVKVHLFNIKQLQVKVFLPNIYTGLSSVKETIVILLLRTFYFSLDLVRDILNMIGFPFV